MTRKDQVGKALRKMRLQPSEAVGFLLGAGPLQGSQDGVNWFNLEEDFVDTVLYLRIGG